jgi:hypothetical protein
MGLIIQTPRDYRMYEGAFVVKDVNGQLVILAGSSQPQGDVCFATKEFLEGTTIRIAVDVTINVKKWKEKV